MAYYRFSFGYGLTPVIKKLMIIMGAVFLLQTLVSSGINLYLGLVPILVWKSYFLWQLATYIFLHGGFSHILFNLLALWMFGGELENYWGSRKFLGYFFFCGIGAGICTVVFSPFQFIPVIGASGAIYGILLAFGWLFPNRPHLHLFSISHPCQVYGDYLRSHRALRFHGRNRRWHCSPHASGWPSLRTHLYGLSSDPAKNSPRTLQTEVVPKRAPTIGISIIKGSQNFSERRLYRWFS